MKYTSRYISVILIAACFMLSACGSVQQKTLETTPIEQPRQTQLHTVNANRFQEASQTTSAVDTSIKLAQEKVAIAEKLIKQKDINKSLSNENVLLQQLNKQLTTELEQTKIELNQTNKLLIKMRIELDEWKTKIIEFHKDSRNTDKAQLEALFKILQLLGPQNEN